MRDICDDCGLFYESMGHSHYCPECRKRRQSEAAKARKQGDIGRKAYAKQQIMRKMKDKSESCKNCVHYKKGPHCCMNTDSRQWGKRVREDSWCNWWKKNEKEGK